MWIGSTGNMIHTWNRENVVQLKKKIKNPLPKKNWFQHHGKTDHVFFSIRAGANYICTFGGE